MPAAEQAHPSNGKKVPYTGKATENPNATIVPGKMRSDREEVPEGFTKEDADKAETMEARIIQRQSARGISGLPGEPNGSPLTRANQAVAQQNRNKTCNLYKTKRPAGQDCDEYPFAATTQGGAVQNRRTWEGSVVNLPPITILDPDDPEVLPNPGMSLSLISSRANRSGGGVLTWFFRKNRVLDGENFYVKGS